MRKSVRLFAKDMEEQLQENEHKGGWEGETYAYLMQRLSDEMGELIYELMKKPYVLHDIIKEATDVGNFAMMIADKARTTIAK